MAEARATIPDVSIVVPTRNRLGLLQQTLASISAQTFDRIETIVVDDASDDGTADWLASLAADRVRTIRLGSHGERSAARNRGLEAARGRFVMFLDDDDLLVGDAIALLVRGLERHPRAVAAIGSYEMFDASGNRVRRPHTRRVIEREAWRDILFHLNAFGGRILFRTEVVRSLGGYRDTLAIAEDWELLLRVSRVGRLLFIPDLVTAYRRHASQTPMDKLDDVIDELASEHLRTWPEDDRRTGERIRAARAIFRRGDRALTELEPRAAVGAFVATVRTYPPVLSFPVARSEVTRRLAKSVGALVVGRTGTRALRRVKALGRRVTRREIGSHVDRSPDRR